MARGLKFRIWEVERFYYPIPKTKALISCAVTAQLICVFVFAYAKSQFSHDEAHILKAYNVNHTSLFTFVKTVAKSIFKNCWKVKQQIM